MTMTKTYAQITREIQALQASAEKMRAAELKSVVAKINESIAAFGLTADDLRFPGMASASRKRSSGSGTASTRPAALGSGVKYSDGQGHVWGGRGPRPAWLRQAIAQGKSLDDFSTSGAKASGRDGSGAKASGKLPPLYGHPKTGQTWSGRGPKPAWLKQALKKRGASIEDFLIATPNSNSPDTQPSDRSPPSAALKNPRVRGNSKAVKGAIGRKSPAKKTTTSGIEKPPSQSRNSRTSRTTSTNTDTDTEAAARGPASGKSANSRARRGAVASDSVMSAKTAARKATGSTGPRVGKGKPQARKTVRPRQQLASSMAPSSAVDAASPASFTPAAAPLPAGGAVSPAEQGAGSNT
jgi:DNA-binding protein H-NS